MLQNLSRNQLYHHRLLRLQIEWLVYQRRWHVDYGLTNSSISTQSIVLALDVEDWLEQAPFVLAVEERSTKTYRRTNDDLAISIIAADLVKDWTIPTQPVVCRTYRMDQIAKDS